MARQEYESLGALAEEEFEQSADQVNEVLESSAGQALDGLPPEEQAAFRRVLSQVRDATAKGLDIVAERQARVIKKRDILEDEKAGILEESLNLDDFFRVVNSPRDGRPSVAAASASVALTVKRVKEITDRVIQETIEIDYRLLLLDISQSNIDQRVSEGQEALANLDKIDTAPR